MKRVFIAGHRGLVGSALVRAIDTRDGIEWFGDGRENLDLTDRQKVFGISRLISQMR